MRERMRAATLALAAGSACAAGAALATRGGATAVAAAVVGAGAVFLLAFAVVASRHARLTGHVRRCSRPTSLGGTTVRVGRLSGSAFVAGLRRPEIYVDRDLARELSSRELEAVALHERGHQVARDPLRLAALAACTPLAAVVPGGRTLVERALARREIVADRFALEHGASRPALASALLRVDSSPVVAPGFTTAVDLRLRALLGEDVTTPRRARRPRYAAAGSVGVGICLLCAAAPHAIAAALHLCCP